MRTQTTLQAAVTRVGVGLHSGETVHCTLHPALEQTGIRFVRTDLPQHPDIPAHLEYVVSTQLSTRLQRGEASVQTIEHLLAALAGLGISNVRVELDGPEVPILDGSAQEWVEAITQVGILTQSSPQPCLRISEPTTIWDGDAFVTAVPAQEWRYTYGIDFPETPIQQQWHSWIVGIPSFLTDIAPARTFVREQDITALQKVGLIKGGSLDNALVAGREGWVNPPLRLECEPVRHKLIDLLGDLSLLGADLQGHILAYKAGHRLHIQLAQQLQQTHRLQPV